MNTFITSDTHFGHGRSIEFCPETRGQYEDAQAMNDDFRRQWNAIVQPDDLVYHLGDVAFMKVDDAVKYLNSLNGKKILVEGNHDRKLLKDPAFRECFVEIHKYLDVSINGHKIIMCHYPFNEWDQMHRGALHFHGHVHGKPTGLERYRILDVGYDATGKIVLPIKDAIKRIVNNEVKSYH